ncbi:MAG TPA: hypothetical protein VNY73_00665, partial [Bacteroidia bacterium]|nr:hypothetical protein [Bacteroidia bacterium]
MKTLKRTRISSLLMVMLLATPFLYGGKGKERKTEKKQPCLEISGEVTTGERRGKKTILVELINENTVVKSLSVGPNQTFSFALESNKQYSIRIRRPGFAPRLVCVSTDVPVDVENALLSKFHFDITIEKQVDIDETSHEPLDFPIAIICYNANKGYF